MKKISFFLLAAAMTNAMAGSTLYQPGSPEWKAEVAKAEQAARAYESSPAHQKHTQAMNSAANQAYDDALKKYGNTEYGKCMAGKARAAVYCQMGGPCPMVAYSCEGREGSPTSAGRRASDKANDEAAHKAYADAIKQYGDNAYGRCMGENAAAAARGMLAGVNCARLATKRPSPGTFTRATGKDLEAAENKAYADAIIKYGDNLCGKCMARNAANAARCRMGAICSNTVEVCECFLE